jgi:membrane protein
VAGPVQLGLLAGREAVRQQLVTKAAELAFFTLLSLVPFLAVATSILGAFGVFDPVEGDLGKYLAVLFPSVGYGVVAYLNEFTTKASGSLGGIGGIGLLVTSLTMFNRMENVMTAIWRGGNDRPILYKFLMFYTMVTLGPVLLMLSVLQTANAQLYVSGLGVDVSFFAVFLPLLYALLVFMLLNKVLPNMPVMWRSALLGGAFSALSFELAKWGFNQYVRYVVLDSYDKLYGALGLAPLVMLWIYLTWIVILLGTEIAFCWQNMQTLLRSDAPLERLWFDGGMVEQQLLHDPMLGVEMIALVAQRYCEGGGAITEPELVAKTGYSGVVVREIVDRLSKGGAVQVVGRTKGNQRILIPARPLEDIQLSEVARVFSGPRKDGLGEQMGALYGEHADAVAQVFEGKNVCDVVHRGRPAQAEELAPVVGGDEEVVEDHSG